MIEYYTIIWEFIIFLFPFLLTMGTSYNCPSVCMKMACDNGILSCSNSGLTSVPFNLPPDTTRVLLINQDFSRAGDLNYDNISNYGPPKYQISKITIQYSKLTGIASESFSHLHHLKTLDLSYNRIRVILSRTFESLNLNFLRLDGNINLQLNCSSFQKSIISHLSLVNCSLQYLDFCTLKPIIGVLKKLILSHNLLKTVDKRYDQLFGKLEELRLDHNPFDCAGCQMQWLSKNLLKRYNNFNQTAITGNIIENIFPKCASPFFLTKTYIHEINETEVLCSVPSIKSIHLKIENMEKLILSCHSQSNSDHVTWYYDSKMENSRKAQSNIVLNNGKPYRNLQCMIQNRNGNISTKINIGWPKFQQIEEGTESTMSSSENVNQTKNVFHLPQFSLLELLGAIFGTFMTFFIIFLFIIRYLLNRNDNHYVQYPVIIDCNEYVRKKSKLDQQNLTLNATYPECELMRYDISSSTSFCNSQTYDVPVFPNSIFLDFKTHKEIHTT